MATADWALLAGLVLLVVVAAHAALHRLPLTRPMVYLALGAGLGPAGLGILDLDPVAQAGELSAVAEAALLVSLLAVGLGLRRPPAGRAWMLPVKLATLSLALMVAGVAAAGAWLLDLPLGAAILLGAILAPTDPVLASALQPRHGVRQHRLNFTLAAEGGLNDGSAYPFAALGLLLLGLHAGSPLRWALVDLAWTTLAGLTLGAALGAAVGWVVLRLRRRHGLAFGLDMFIGLGLIATAYGLAHRIGASAFLAVFAAGLALAPARAQPQDGSDAGGGTVMRRGVEDMNEQLEKLAELVVVLLVGALLPQVPLHAAAWWFVPLVLLVLRPLSVLPAHAGEGAGRAQLAMGAWFGIRGIGSVYYLLDALRAGLPQPLASTLLSLKLWTVAASIVLHGLTAAPLMRRYEGLPP
jgi:NhaP-type Na+/H+ or K+/H+ antiporter